MMVQSSYHIWMQETPSPEISATSMLALELLFGWAVFTYLDIRKFLESLEWLEEMVRRTMCLVLWAGKPILDN